MVLNFWRKLVEQKEKQAVVKPKYVSIDHSITLRDDTASNVLGVINNRNHRRMTVNEIVNKNKIIVESIDLNSQIKTVSDYITDFTIKGMRIASKNGSRKNGDVLKFKFKIGIEEFKTLEGIITSVKEGNPDIESEARKTLYGIKFTRAIESEVRQLETLKGSMTLLKRI